jgi:hypothetical protein
MRKLKIFKNHSLKQILLTDFAIFTYLAIIKIMIHFLANGNYGFHRDEFLYIAMGEHLDWGFLEVPPFIAVIAKLSRFILGDSLFAFRVLPTLAGAIIVYLIGYITKELGGKQFAQILAIFCFIFSPGFLGSGYLLQPVVFNQLFWTSAIYILIKIIKYGHHKYWIYLGLICGIGLLTKYTMLLLGFAIFLGMLFSSNRFHFKTKWPWIGGGISFLIFLPNLIWQNNHNWPLIDHLKTLHETQLVNMQPSGFLIMQILATFWAFPIAAFGFYYFFFNKENKKYITLGFVYLIPFTILLLTGGKPYYLFPVYPMLFAGGSYFIEQKWLSKKRIFQMVAIVWIILNNLITIPYAIPILPIKTFKVYANFMAVNFGLDAPLRWEDGKVHSNRQDYADMFGWENQVSVVARVFHNLTESEKADCTLLASNYGQAGAFEYYRLKYNIPKVVSFSSSYYLWGSGEVEKNIVITIGFSESVLKDYCPQLELLDIITHDVARETNISVYICRQPKQSLRELWPDLYKYRF